jgi:CBS domain-containing protein
VSPRSISELALHHPPVLRETDTVDGAVRTVLESGMPALAVVDAGGCFSGIFGEREFMAALFPGYLAQLRQTAFLPRSLDAALEQREACREEPISRYMTTDHVEVGPDFSDTQIAEIFLHHRVLVVPVVAGGRVDGLLTRRDFFRAVAERFVSDQAGRTSP